MILFERMEKEDDNFMKKGERAEERKRKEDMEEEHIVGSAVLNYSLSSQSTWETLIASNVMTLYQTYPYIP